MVCHEVLDILSAIRCQSEQRTDFGGNPPTDLRMIFHVAFSQIVQQQSQVQNVFVAHIAVRFP